MIARGLAIASALGGWLLLAPPLSAQSAGDGTGGALTVRSDVQEADSEAGVITARGNVQISYPARQLEGTAAQAQFYQNERRLVLRGDVYILQEGNSIRAETITYLIDEGRIVATPERQSQVESTYIVNETASGGDSAGATDSTPTAPDPTVPSLAPIPSGQN